MPELPHQVTLAAIPYRARAHEGAVVFTCESGFAGSSCRMCFTRAAGIWRLELFGTFGPVSVSHIQQAFAVVEATYGGNHHHQNGEDAP